MPAPQFNRTVKKEDPAKENKNQLHRFPKTRGDGRMQLVDLVGPAEINAIIASGSIEFVATGDTGRGKDTEQEEVADAMARDVDATKPADGPTFFLNLGDIIYGPNKNPNYANKFYRPNKEWLQPAPGFNGIILGIPGNHDGEVRDRDDRPSLKAFMDNFCGHDLSMAESFGAVMPKQPGPYWWLDGPFLDLIGLYSNAAEDFGLLGADPHETHQEQWLLKTLKAIKKARATGPRKALVFATHHPPYSKGLSDKGSGHAGSPEMLAQIDAACAAAGIQPDMFLSGHSHNYQRYMRTMNGSQRVIPYLVAGTGGIGSQPAPANIGAHASDKTSNVVYASGLGKQDRNVTAFGYLRVRANAKLVQFTFVRTLGDHRNPFETRAINLATGQETAPEFDS
jgi:hypothetical protein